MVAHSVGHHAAILAGGSAHLTAGAHAEGVHAPLAHMLAKLIFAPRQGRVPGSTVVKALFNFCLQMFRAESHRKRFAFQRQAHGMQHGKGIPRAVAHCQDQLVAEDAARRGSNAAQRAAAGLQAGQRRVKVYFPAKVFDLSADAGNNAAQQVSAHMGLLPPGDIRRGAVLQKGVRHKAAQRIPHAGGQLAVRECSCAALAKLDIGVGVQRAGLLKLLHSGHTVRQGRTALQHNGVVTIAGQQQGRKQPRRAKADHHRAVFQWCLTNRKGKIRFAGETDTGRGPGQSRFLTLVMERDGDGIHQHRRAMPGIHRKFCHASLRRSVAPQAQRAVSLPDSFLLRVRAGKRQADIAYKNHGLMFSFGWRASDRPEPRLMDARLL